LTAARPPPYNPVSEDATCRRPQLACRRVTTSSCDRSACMFGHPAACLAALVVGTRAPSDAAAVPAWAALALIPLTVVVLLVLEHGRAAPGVTARAVRRNARLAVLLLVLAGLVTLRYGFGVSAPGPVGRSVRPEAGAGETSSLRPVAARRSPSFRSNDEPGGMDRPAEPLRLQFEADGPGIVRRKWELNGESRSCLVFRRTGSAKATMDPRPGERLVFSVGTGFPRSSSRRSSVCLRVTAEGEAGGPELLYEAEWERLSTSGQQWETVVAEIGQGAGGPVTVRFAVTVTPDGLEGGEGPALAVSDPQAAGPGGAGRPNIIVYSIETTRRDHMSLYGYHRRTSPFLEELAQESIVFEDAYSQSSWTKPTVASLLTGLQPCQHGANEMLGVLAGSHRLLPEILREAGYRTAGFMTTHIVSDPRYNYDQGFDLFVNAGHVLAAEVHRRVLAWLDAERPAPFFIFVHSYDPHEPYCAPGALRDCFDSSYDGEFRDELVLEPSSMGRRLEVLPGAARYAVARYDAEILYADMALRRLSEELKQRELWEDTLLVVTADHGERFGDHGQWSHGGNLFPELLRVPLLVKLPAGEETPAGGSRVRGPASTVDVMPTVLTAAGVAVPAGLPGMDLLGGVDETGRSPRVRHLAELHEYPRLLSERPARELPRVHHSLISDRFQYIRVRSVRTGEPPHHHLYDLVADSAALQNLALTAPAVLDEYRATVRQMYDRTGYTVAVNGDGRAGRLVGTVRTDGTITEVSAERVEEEDAWSVGQDGHELRFDLSPGVEDDVLRFAVDPLDAPARFEFGGSEARLFPVYLGPGRIPHTGGALEVGPGRCAVDTDFGGAMRYVAGEEAGVFVWRQGVSPQAEAASAEEDAETMRALKDLGYM
jgi:arylsulfatase A-like enzyme